MAVRQAGKSIIKDWEITGREPVSTRSSGEPYNCALCHSVSRRLGQNKYEAEADVLEN